MADAVPVIDLEPYRTGSATARVARAVDEACRRTGFLVVSGHGVPQATIDGMIDAMQRFFALPLEDKLAAASRDAAVFRGYAKFEGRSLAKSTGAYGQPDLREAFTINRVQDKSDPYYHAPAAGKLFAPNIWPSAAHLTGFEGAFTAYYLALDRLSLELTRIFALALGLPEQFFDDKFDKHFSNLSAFHYPPLHGVPVPGQLRGGAHTDFGSLTLVYGHPTARGLQVWNGTEWDDVPAIAGTFVVNVGDLMAQWTNDRWVSTLHRVANPPDAEVGQSRYSIAFFHQPNYDALIESLDPTHEPKYPPITSGEHLKRKLSAMS